MQRLKTKIAHNRRKIANNRTKTVRTSPKAKRAPRQARRRGSHIKDTGDPNTPVLTPCILHGPDGKVRPGWELRIGGILFGRADTKESLLQYYARIHEPMPSGHWRERAWQSPQRHVPARRVRRNQEFYDEETEAEEVDLTAL